MNTDNKILNETNPVYNTAKLTLSILGNAGVPEAMVYAEKLGLTDFRKQFDVDSKNKNELPQAILQETRYAFLNRCIRESGCKNIVDIACGFSPRGYVMAKEGYNYLGLDLEASVGALNALAKEFDGENLPGTFRYKACDLTNPVALEEALADMEGEVFIVCEGLMMYFQPYETKSLAEGLHNVLQKHGGHFVTGDFAFSDLYVNVHIGVLGKEEGMKALIAMASATIEKSDTNFSDSLVKAGGSPKAVELYEETGFAIRLIPYYTEEEEVCIFKNLDAAIVAGAKASMAPIMAWDVTVKDGAAIKQEKVAYKAECSVKNKVLCFALQGRVDSITSSDFLLRYEDAKENGDFDKIHVDMSKLQYISSAGLRVLMKMRKDMPVICKGVSEDVMEVFETTGFADMLKFE